MDTLTAIATRRSIRHFQQQAIPRDLIEQVLQATIQAPSAKNVQPWRFVILEGEEHLHLVQLMREAASQLKAQGIDIGSLEGTARAMRRAPVTIVVFNAPPPPEVPEEGHDDWNHVMLQSTGGAIQTMLLAAHALGLGSLWICDILYAYDAVRAWLGRPEHTLVACVTLGYADEAPAARPRMAWQQVTEWRGGATES